MAPRTDKPISTTSINAAHNDDEKHIVRAASQPPA